MTDEASASEAISFAFCQLPLSLYHTRYSDSTDGERTINAFETESLEGLDAGFILKLTHAQLEPICFWSADQALADKWFEAFHKNAIA